MTFHEFPCCLVGAQLQDSNCQDVVCSWTCLELSVVSAGVQIHKRSYHDFAVRCDGMHGASGQWLLAWGTLWQQSLLTLYFHADLTAAFNPHYVCV
jgi:hypothetical protein